MTAIEEPQVRRTAGPSRCLRVVIRTRGVLIPSLGSDKPLTTTAGDLILLDLLTSGTRSVDEAVAAASEASGEDPGRLRTTLDTLAGWGLLRDEPADLVPHPAEDATAQTTGPVDSGGLLALATPQILRPSSAGFEALDHEGRIQVRLRGLEVAAMAHLRSPATADAAYTAHCDELGPGALDRSAFDALVGRLIDAGLVGTTDGGDGAGHTAQRLQKAFEQMQELARIIGAQAAAHDAAEAERRQRTGVRRTRIVPVQHNGTLAPLALGMIYAYAKAYDGGRLEEHYDFNPRWATMRQHVPALTEEPGIFLFSNYHWSHAENLDVSAAVKERSPGSLTIHGGPDTPKYQGDVETYFRAHPHVDITVRGEGEATMAELLDALIGVVGAGSPDLSCLADVAGISFRDGDRIVRTADRDRIADVDTIPSPYLTGLFDAYGEATAPTAIIETNRGCPYGCTFCDWGSSTNSRIRKFDLDRVFAELEWCARNGVPRIFLADANFGIFERDVEIAEKVAELKQTYGYPKMFITNYAKNTVKHLRKIVQTMVDAGILTEGLLSLQSMDEDTLSTIRRSNIKLEKYEALAGEFRRADLPLYVDLMLGLPGSTTEGFRNDLQQCMDREVTAKIFLTELLVNSPMNEPEYRQEHQIQTAQDDHGVYGAGRSAAGTTNRALVVSTSSFTREDYEEMKQLRRVHTLAENFGALRHVARYVRQELGIREIDLFERLRLDASADRERWPTIAFTLLALPDIMAPPVSWRLFLDEVHRYVVDELGLADDSALATVLTVQHALLPARGRPLPMTVTLDHDYPAWYAAVVAAKDDGHWFDWQEVVPRLRDLGPATFEVDDPNDVCIQGIGFRFDLDSYANWELASPVRRQMSAPRLAH